VISIRNLGAAMLVRRGRVRVANRILNAVLVPVLVLIVTAAVSAQSQRPAMRTGRAAALNDLTGYWVSIVNEDWRLRMIVPDPRDYLTLPLTAAASKVADAWDPAADKAAGNECKSYGAAAIMRVPGRLHIYWQDDNTLRIDTDSGTQTRSFHFGGSAPRGTPLTWQGYSVASWVGQKPISTAGAGRPGSQGTRLGGQAAVDRREDVEPGQGQLRVITTHMRPGYLRKNGVPYSGNVLLEEYFDRFTEPNGDTWLVVTSIVTDPEYLVEPYITGVHFKKIPDGSGWDPTPCRVDQAR
jgi:hypothetical protein